MGNKKVELLAPAGDLEKLKVAIAYGADAVYIGGQRLGLRAKAKNFDIDEMAEGVRYAHEHNVKVYVTANIFAHNDDFKGMGEYFEKLYEIGVDALIISDLGVFSLARKIVPNMEIHISTQANNTNYHTVNFWLENGAKRVVLARELSFCEISEIHDNIVGNGEIEAFVHGAMCISYSGRCLISNYLNERDANRGECSQPCRWQYSLVEKSRPNEDFPIEEDERGTYFFNSKDLCMIERIPELVEAGISSFKIEGRMKTPYYVATVVKAYREAIDDYYENPELYKSKLGYYMSIIEKSSYRDFTKGFYYGKPSGKEQIYNKESAMLKHDFRAIVLSYDEKTGIAKVQQRNKMVVGESFEILRAKGDTFVQKITEMIDEDGNSVPDAPHPLQILYIKMDKEVEEFDIFRLI